MLLLTLGNVCVKWKVYDGKRYKEIPIFIICAGELLGLLEVLYGLKSICTITAETACEVVELSKDMLSFFSSEALRKHINASISFWQSWDDRYLSTLKALHIIDDRDVTGNSSTALSEHIAIVSDASKRRSLMGQFSSMKRDTSVQKAKYLWESLANTNALIKASNVCHFSLLHFTFGQLNKKQIFHMCLQNIFFRLANLNCSASWNKSLFQ